ncbi:MAG: alpha-L-fucosidase [Microbacteriaceae bacterium]|nr:alpha-L-fucosidase [Microbacteriaceae bacterium]
MPDDTKGIVNAYLNSRRRLLLDMHIPDWNERFLADYEPAELARLYQLAGADGALLYCKSHLGLNYWPAPVGGIHRAAHGRDLVGEAKAALEKVGIAVAAYHSVIFDSWAAEEHPEWRIVPASREAGKEWTILGHRYGTMCPNHPEYVDYEKAQITALLGRYDFETLWLDMAFWTAVCVCDACAVRFRAEHGMEIPRVIDWGQIAWTTFQSARERWIAGFAADLMDTARQVRPGIALTHNLAPGLRGWFQGQRAQDTELDDFAAGDLYGGFDEQVFVLALMQGFRRPSLPEFMTTRTRDLFNHSSTKTEHEMLTQAFAAVAANAAFLFIDAVDPSGQLNEKVYERIGRVFEATRKFEAETGGTEITDVAVYYADDSRIDETGVQMLADAVPGGESRHQDAVMGAVRALRRGHIPFSVVTRLDNERLKEFSVVILPDARRLSSDDIFAVRAYVAGGGRLYASGGGSLLRSDGSTSDDFALADVFGCTRVATEEGVMVYLRPETPGLEAAMAPEPFLPIGQRLPRPSGAGAPLQLPRISATKGARVIARLTLPFGYPSDGSMTGRDFASIHSSPPWDDTPHPSIVVNDFGAGRVVYSSAPIESAGSPAHEAVFLHVLNHELGLDSRLTALGHPDVWVTAFDQPERKRIIVSALRLTDDAPGAPEPVTVRLRVPEDFDVAVVRDVSSGEPCRWRVDGSIASIDVAVDVFDMVAIELTPHPLDIVVSMGESSKQLDP